MATAFSTLTNQAMRIEREHVLQAEAHQRTTGRSGYANGFKPKSLHTRVGEVSLQIPQTRDYHDENGHPFLSTILGSWRSQRAGPDTCHRGDVRAGCQHTEGLQDPKRHGTRAEDGDGLDGARGLRRIFDADESAEARRRLRETVTRYQKTAPEACLSRPQRDQQRMGDRKGLHEHGSHVTRPLKPRFTEEMLLYRASTMATRTSTPRACAMRLSVSIVGFA